MFETTGAWLITFTTYGSWLHGDVRGSNERASRQRDFRLPRPQPRLEAWEREQMTQPPMTLDWAARRVVQNAIIAVCKERGWRLLALNVRSTHAHAVVCDCDDGDLALLTMKAAATRLLVEVGLATAGRHVWSKHGSTRRLLSVRGIQRACEYVVERQGWERGWVNPRESWVLARE